MLENAPLAYRYVVIAAMIAEINFCSDRLNLPIKHPVEEEDIKKELIFRPHNNIPFSSAIFTSNYLFTFHFGEKLAIIRRLHMWDNIVIEERQEQLAQIKCQIDTNDALGIARKALVAMDLDVHSLEHDYAITIKQRAYQSSFSRKEQMISLPLFDVTWGNWTARGGPAVTAVIAGNTGDVLELDLQRAGLLYSHRPSGIIRDINGLLSISDDEFRSYTPLEKSNLLTRFLAVHYPPQKHLPARPILPYVTLSSTNIGVPRGDTNAARVQ